MKDRGEKKFVDIPFFLSHKFHKLVTIFFELLKKKIWANFQRIIELFTHNIVTKLSKIWVWDTGSEIRDPGKTYSGSRIQRSKRHRILDPDPQHCNVAVLFRIRKYVFIRTPYPWTLKSELRFRIREEKLITDSGFLPFNVK